MENCNKHFKKTKMKKIVLSAGLFVAAAFFAGAQDTYDAILFSQNHYYGTARSMALGNAMTALGGDLGSIGINPAGSAVAPSSPRSPPPSRRRERMPTACPPG